MYEHEACIRIPLKKSRASLEKLGMYSFATALVLLILLIWRRPAALVQWPIAVLIIYCLVGSATLWLATHVDGDFSTLILSFIEQKSAIKADVIMGSGSLVVGLGLLWGSKNSITFEYGQPQIQYSDDRVIRNSLLLALPLCSVILFAWVQNLSAGGAEEIRLQLLQTGYWPFITALFGWFLPILIVAYVSRANGLIAARGYLNTTVAAIAAVSIALSVLIGFRTYAALAVLIGITFYTLNRRISLVALILSFLSVIFVFILVTIIRVQDGNVAEITGVLYSIFRRLAFEPIGAAELLFSLVDRNGYFLGLTLLMDLHSKMPGRQETFAGLLGQEAGFDEGLTLTASGIMEIYANFSYFGLPVLLAISYAAGRCLTNKKRQISSNLATRLFAFLFMIDFIMGGSSAIFDLLVRLFLFRFALKFKLFT